MAEIQLTINPRTVERVLFVFIILILLGLNVYHWVNKPGIDQSVTGQVTQDLDSQAAAAAKTTVVPETPAASCSDSIKNQDETDIDCGGTCNGYWYDGKCNTVPKPAEPAPECRLKSDCNDSFECKDGTCVELPPECTENDDCTSTEICKERKCEDRPLSGDLAVSIETVTVGKGAGNATDRKKVTEVKLAITNGLSKSMTLSGKAYVYYGPNDPMYSLSTKFDIGRLKSGESSVKYYNVEGKTFKDEGEQMTIRIEIFDENGEQLDTEPMTITKKFTP
ncbi:MAG: hypothetical protein V1743_03010 [Nanoarchaeota archaeon]